VKRKGRVRGKEEGKQGNESSPTVRIAGGQGFWGDWPEAPYRQVTGGPIDYLMMDYLAEVTMSIMQKQKSRDPSLGYAKDFVPLMERILPTVAARGIKVTANAGGVNPRACAEAVAAVARRLGLAGKLTIGVVTGDDLLGRLDGLLARGHELLNLDTGRPLRDVRDRVRSANAYLGAWPVVDALNRGADVVITGRVTDTGLTLAPMIHAFGWRPDDWDRLAAGTVAGHIIECGAQASGGNCLLDWEDIPDLANVGYPIVDAHPDGTFEITKHPKTGGRVSVAEVSEQLVYEMGDPANYITPDCVADFTTIELAQAGKDRVRVSGVRGKPATAMLKVSVAYFYGYKAVGTLVYAWPDALRKAQAADRILRERLQGLGLRFEAILTEFVGADATHGPLARASAPLDELPEVELRVGVRSQDLAAVERFTREIAPLILNGPPSVTGFAGGRPKPEEIVAYWPALIDKTLVEPCVELVHV
jgi:acyclic terpene utilization AtuA family protein